jgi:myo-inositol-1(or 4)-monophosphatase
MENERRAGDEMLASAIAFAAQKHCCQIRKGSNRDGLPGVPYIVHPMEVAAIVATMTQDRDVLAAAVLHDVMEDSGVTREELESRFNAHVAALVCAESEDKHSDRPKADTWFLRKYATLCHLRSPHVTREEKILCLGDKLSNLRATARDCKLLGTPYWDRFNQKDPRAIKWYYVGVGKALADLADYDAYTEYRALLAHTFEGYEDLSGAELAAFLPRE